MNRIVREIRAFLQRFTHKRKHMNHTGKKRKEWAPIPGMELQAGETVEQWRTLHEAIWKDGFIPLLRNGTTATRPIIKLETERFIQLSPQLTIQEILRNGTQEDRGYYNDLHELAARWMGAAFGPGARNIRLFKPEYATFRPVTYIHCTARK